MSYREDEVVAVVERLTVQRLRRWVQSGWIRPEQQGRAPRFTDIDIARIRLLCELSDELSIDSAAMPVVLSLLDQVYGLRRELRRLARAVERQPKPMRERIARAFREDAE